MQHKAQDHDYGRNLIQGSPEWLTFKCGKVGASRMADLIAKTKTGWGASRANYMAELIAERLTGVPAERYTNGAMQWGTEYRAAGAQGLSVRDYVRGGQGWRLRAPDDPHGAGKP